MRRASSGLLLSTLLCGCVHRQMAPPKAVAVEPVSAAMTAELPPPPPKAEAPANYAVPPPLKAAATTAVPTMDASSRPVGSNAGGGATHSSAGGAGYAKHKGFLGAIAGDPLGLGASARGMSAPSPRAASSHDAGGAASAAPVDEATAAEQWRDALPTGGLKHHVDPVMMLQMPATVTVTIEGDKAAPSAPDTGESAPVALKISPEMVVVLSAPGYEDQFKISPDTPQQKMVLHDGSTVWTWTVTPQHEGDGQLQIDAYVLYKDDATHQIPLPSVREKVHVRSIPPKTFLERGWEWMQEHPGESLKYILPGGAGAAMLHQLVLWWQRRRKRAVGAVSPPEDVS